VSGRRELLANEKESLVAQSTMYRRRLRREGEILRQSLSWKRAVIATVSGPALQRMVFGVALTLVGLGRAARWIVIAGRVVVAAKIATAAIGGARKLAKSSP
jgi:hypothetical protein